MKIESLTNARVKEWEKLKVKKFRDEKGLFLIEGEHLLKEALKKGVVKEIISSNLNWKKEEIPFYEVTDAILKKLSSQVSGTNVIAICKKLEEKEIKGNVCMLDGIQDPGNLGTIIRSCVAFGIDTLIISHDTVDLYNEKVIRASEGLLFHLNIIKKNINSYVEVLKNKGYTLYATNVKKGIFLNNVEPERKYAIIMGNEGKGVKENISKQCDVFLTIPINNACESLNVAIATSIILYAFNRK